MSIPASGVMPPRHDGRFTSKMAVWDQKSE